MKNLKLSQLSRRTTEQPRTCPICNTVFKPHVNAQITCSPTCAKKHRQNYLREFKTKNKAYLQNYDKELRKKYVIKNKTNGTVICPKCGKSGIKIIFSKTRNNQTAEYTYVQHNSKKDFDKYHVTHYAGKGNIQLPKK